MQKRLVVLAELQVSGERTDTSGGERGPRLFMQQNVNYVPALPRAQK